LCRTGIPLQFAVAPKILRKIMCAGRKAKSGNMSRLTMAEQSNWREHGQESRARNLGSNEILWCETTSANQRTMISGGCTTTAGGATMTSS
jgi:hypothetical protein